MKKNKVFIFLAWIFILQLAVPVSIMGMREIASEKGLQGKLKVENVLYSSLKETLDFDVSRFIDNDGGSGNYVPVHLDKNGYIIGKEYTAIKPSVPYIDWEKYRTMRKYKKFEKYRLDFIVSEDELHRLTLSSISDKYYDNKTDFYVTVSIYDGEVIFKELWEGDTKLLEFS